MCLQMGKEKRIESVVRRVGHLGSLGDWSNAERGRLGRRESWKEKRPHMHIITALKRLHKQKSHFSIRIPCVKHLLGRWQQTVTANR